MGSRHSALQGAAPWLCKKGAAAAAAAASDITLQKAEPAHTYCLFGRPKAAAMTHKLLTPWRDLKCGQGPPALSCRQEGVAGR